MKLTDRRKEEIVTIILNRVDDVRKIFLFGSRAERTQRNRSDIDIGFIAEKPVSFAVMEKLEEDIDNLETLCKFDIVDFTDRDDEFTKEAMRTIEVWYEKG